MDIDPLTPGGPAPPVDTGDLRRRVRERVDLRRRRRNRRTRFTFGALAVVSIGAAGVFAARPDHLPDETLTAAELPDSTTSSSSGPSSTSTTAAGPATSDRLPESSTPSSESTTTTTTTTDPPSQGPSGEACPEGLDGAIDGDAAGLDVTLNLRGSGDALEGTVHIVNRGPGTVTIVYSPGGLDVIGLNEAGIPVRGGDGRLRAALIASIPEGEATDLPAYVHRRVCGPGDDPVEHVALVGFSRRGAGNGGLTVGREG